MTMLNTIQKTDAQLKADVLSELEYEPSVKVTDIGVLVRDGTVALNGYATSYGEKIAAVRAVKRIAGVKGIADDIEVQLMGFDHHTDEDIAAAAVRHIEWNKLLPQDRIVVTVSQGWITLTGDLEWQYQKNAVANIVEHLSGVKGVFNLIEIESKLTPMEIETAITAAFARNALLAVRKIQVETIDHKVKLRGNVKNFTEREEAERVAWAAPGVSEVDNQLTTKWDFEESDAQRIRADDARAKLNQASG